MERMLTRYHDKGIPGTMQTKSIRISTPYHTQLAEIAEKTGQTMQHLMETAARRLLADVQARGIVATLAEVPSNGTPPAPNFQALETQTQEAGT